MATAYESRSGRSLRARQALNQIACSADQGIWGAHRGCAVLAGLLLIEQQRVPFEVVPRIEQHLQQLPEPGFLGQDGRESVLPLPAFAASVLEALGEDAATPKELGHDVIYSGYVLRALEVFGIGPSDALQTGLLHLIRQVRASGPGYITVNGRNEVRLLPTADDQFNGELGLHFHAWAGRPRPRPQTCSWAIFSLTVMRSDSFVHGPAPT